MKYEDRISDDDDVCTCGHKRSTHTVGFIDWLFERKTKGDCIRCMCPKFDLS